MPFKLLRRINTGSATETAIVLQKDQMGLLNLIFMRFIIYEKMFRFRNQTRFFRQEIEGELRIGCWTD